MDSLMRAVAGRLVIMFLLFASLLFFSAGTLFWIPGWLFLFLYFSFVVLLSLWLLRHDPDLLKERLRGLKRSQQKSWDWVLMLWASILFLAWLAAMPLDAVRLHWSHLPLWTRALGGVLLMCSFYFFYLVFRENSYLSPMVRVQHDRGQKVIFTGPYHYVRHPMYSSIILFLVGTSLMLGSWLGLVLGMIIIGVVARRAVLEERLLEAELDGYARYQSQVKYRLIPHLW